MTITTAERPTQALTEIAELITAVAGVQALIQAGVESPYCPTITAEELGKAFLHLATTLRIRAWQLRCI